MIVTPLLKISTIEPFIAHVGFVSHDDVVHKSSLMNIPIKEDVPFTAEIVRLTPQEHELACNLQAKRWGEGVRLEQERIRFSEVESSVATLISHWIIVG